MSVQQALLFMAKMRSDAGLRAAFGARQDEIGLEELVAAGASHGLDFDACELRAAFRHEWALRALRGRALRGLGPAG